MSRLPDRRDPFETLVELTAAAVRGRPPRDFVYLSYASRTRPSLLQRLAGMLERARPLPPLPVEPGLAAANEPDIHDSKLLQRYY